MARNDRKEASRRLAGGLALGVLLVLRMPEAEAAEAQGWLSAEARVPVAPWSGPLPTFLAFSAQSRFRPEATPLDTVLMRAGPFWEVSSWLRTGFNLLAKASREEERLLRQEFRLELEPTLRTRWGAVELANRHRVELRVLEADSGWRYRFRLQLRLRPEGARWVPFVSNELLVGLGGSGLEENRLLLGVGRELSDGVRLNLAWQARLFPGGQQPRVVHVLLFHFLFAPSEPLPPGD